MADARIKNVLRVLADLYGRVDLYADKLKNLSSEVQLGDTLEIPEIGTLTIGEAVDGSLNAQDVSAQVVSPSKKTLTVDEFPAINIQLEELKRMQVMGGNYYDLVTEQAFQQLRNSIDQNLVNETIKSAWATGTSAGYHDNVAGDALSVDDLLGSIAAIDAIDGMHRKAFFMSPYGLGSMLRMTGFVPNTQALADGVMGIPRVGSFYGVPVFSTNSVRNGRTIAASSSSITSNVITFTVAAGHGVTAGMKLTSSGATANITTAAVVTSTTSTTIVAPLTAGNDASNGAATITLDSSENMLVDLEHAYIGLQKLPSVRVVADPDAPFCSNIQLGAVYGFYFRPSYARIIHSPKSAVA